MTADVATWERLLERLEVDLDAAKQALDRGEDVKLPGFVPPRDLPSLPPECATRARRVLDQQLAFEASLAEKAAALGTQMSSRSANAATHQHRHQDPARHGARFETRV